MKLRIVVDSVSDIPRSVAEALDIVIVPLQVHFEGRSYRDGEELDGPGLFRLVEASQKLPTTSQVTPGQFAEVFQREVDAGRDLIVLTMSSKMSGTYQTACAARELVAPERITVFDSKGVTFGYGLIAILAARMIQQGSDKNAVLGAVSDMIERQVSKFIVDTLDYLRRGGRLSAGEAFVGGLLNIKPILTVTDGVLHAEEKVRGRKKAFRYLCDWLHTENIDLSGKTVALYHAADQEHLKELEAALREEFLLGEVIYSEVGAVVGTHSGPGCVAISFIR